MSSAFHGWLPICGLAGLVVSKTTRIKIEYSKKSKSGHEMIWFWLFSYVEKV